MHSRVTGLVARDRVREAQTVRGAFFVNPFSAGCWASCVSPTYEERIDAHL
jgi:hypothetical protein